MRREPVRLERGAGGSLHGEECLRGHRSRPRKFRRSLRLSQRGERWWRHSASPYPRTRRPRVMSQIGHRGKAGGHRRVELRRARGAFRHKTLAVICNQAGDGVCAEVGKPGGASAPRGRLPATGAARRVRRGAALPPDVRVLTGRPPPGGPLTPPSLRLWNGHQLVDGLQSDLDATVLRFWRRVVRRDRIESRRSPRPTPAPA